MRLDGSCRLLYVLIGLLSFPYYWFYCEAGWYDPHLYRIACWVDPVVFLTVPTLSFLLDLFQRISLRGYLIRSGIEIVVITPIWIVLWDFFACFVLGWVWILAGVGDVTPVGNRELNRLISSNDPVPFQYQMRGIS